jgi:hypothetical protein
MSIFKSMKWSRIVIDTIVTSNIYIYTCTVQLLIDCETHFEGIEREQLALLVTQCNFQGQHTYNCIILFIAIFGKERTSNEREKRKKIGDFPGWSFVFFLTGFNADVWVCHNHIYELFFFLIMQHTKLKKEKKRNRMKNRRSKEKKKNLEKSFEKERILLRMCLHKTRQWHDPERWVGPVVTQWLRN